jgi:hypothetical protein
VDWLKVSLSSLRNNRGGCIFTECTDLSNATLAESGTVWNEGVRRSQRIRVRPLEWWRGEKLLYGRINKSKCITASSPNCIRFGATRCNQSISNFVGPCLAWMVAALTTVIGIKRSSPGKYAAGISQPFVVESYVPDEYSELVKFAAI